MKRTRLHLFSILSIVSLAISLAACHGSGDDGPAEGIDNAAEAIERALAPREVSLVQPDVRDENSSVELVGEIRAFDTVVISSEVGGRVDRVLVEVGDEVAKGAPLVEVDRETFAIYLAQAEANVRAAGANLSLAEKDLERKTGPSVGRDHPPGDPRPGPGRLRTRVGRGCSRRGGLQPRQAQPRPQRDSGAGRRRGHRAHGRGRPVG